MTYGIKHIAGGLALLKKKPLPQGFFGTDVPLFGGDWKKQRLCGSFVEKGKEWTVEDIWTYVIGAHCAHAMEFTVAVICYMVFYQDGTWLTEAKELHVSWISRIFFFNLCCEMIVCNFWHYFTYVSPLFQVLREGDRKLNKENQYEPQTDKVGLFFSSTGNLEREIFFTTLGWLQSAFWQCTLTYCWANGYLPCYADFWSYPVYSLVVLWLIAYWREIHFYMCHRGSHPWWDRKNSIWDGDIGAFLYRHVHSLHHKSHNPGPWSGLCMHPVEHLLYYGCAILPPLFMAVHPFHFLYCKFHADIAPIGGHDGMDEPGGKGDFHWLHHSKFECNYGVPFPINLDLLFGTWADYDTYKATGELTVGDWAKEQMHTPEEEEKASGGDTSKPLLDSESAATKESGDASYGMDDLAKHKSPGDVWITLYGKVLNVSRFVDAHPGGKGVLLAMAGKDATSEFEKIHASSGGYNLVRKMCPDAVIGSLRDYSGPAPPEASEEKISKWPGALFFYPVFLAFGTLAMRS